MYISESAAGNIVREISSTIHQAVNLMDDTGKIIASTDPGRIGILHKGAERIIREKLDYLEIYTDGEYQGAKTGINLPIYMKGSVAGVIGISGEWNQIEPYLNLIQKTAETLVMNSYLQKREDEMQREQQKFLYRLLFEKEEQISEEFLSEGRTLGIDLSVKRRCLCVSYADETGGFPEEIRELLDELEEILKRLCGYQKNCLIYREMVQLTLFPEIAGSEALSDGEVTELEKVLRSHVLLKEKIHMKIGIDDQSYCGAALRTGRMRAEKSLKSAMTGQDTVCYKDMTAGVFLSDIGKESKWEYIRKIFGNMPEPELEHWMKILEIFYECSGSISRTSEKLFIHKNTLQYQLKKLAAKTSYDPRDIRFAGVYQNAIWFWKTVKKK